MFNPRKEGGGGMFASEIEGGVIGSTLEMRGEGECSAKR